jgi:hypothetical protein
VVTATDQTVAAGQSLPFSSIYSVSGSGVTEYQVWFSWPEGGDPADGMVTNNGTPIAADQWDTVSSLSGLAFVGSVTPGTDHIWLQAYNGGLRPSLQRWKRLRPRRKLTASSRASIRVIAAPRIRSTSAT